MLPLMTSTAGGRPKTKKTKVVPVSASPRLLEYLDDLVAMEGYGASRAEVARNFVWKEVNRLIEADRLPDRGAPIP
jgi:hypothetical protein